MTAPAPRRGWITGLSVYGYEHAIGQLDAEYIPPVRNPVPVVRKPVQVNVRYVRVAKPATMAGRPGYLLWQAGRRPVAWVPAAAWLAATS